MRIVALTSPGRFPTVVIDPGRWWPAVASRGHELLWYQANTAWWRVLCGEAVHDALLASLSRSDSAAAWNGRRRDWT